MDSAISTIHARQVFDSRGDPTVEVDVTLADGSFGRAAVPSGRSKGQHEALELRNGKADEYGSRGVSQAVANVNDLLSRQLRGLNALDQLAVDQRMIDLDGTSNKRKLGANTMTGVSLATVHAAADHLKVPLFRYLGGLQANLLPVPLMNIVNGGRHARNGLDVQEFMIVPLGFQRFDEAFRCGVEIFKKLADLLDSRGFSTNVGDEGGFAPGLSRTEDALQLIEQAIGQTRYRAGEHVWLTLDVAASELYGRDTAGHYSLDGQQLTSEAMVLQLEAWVDRHPICSIEDGCSENDREGWRLLTDRLESKVQLVGDDLFVTDWKRLRQGIGEGIASSLLVKVDQIGTLTETLQAIETARNHGYTQVISHRSGETEDTTIADLAVAIGSGQIKAGSASRGERTAKYNRLLRIEEQLGGSARYGGPSFPRTASVAGLIRWEATHPQKEER
jgi:enolase